MIFQIFTMCPIVALLCPIVALLWLYALTRVGLVCGGGVWFLCLVWSALAQQLLNVEGAG